MVKLSYINMPHDYLLLLKANMRDGRAYLKKLRPWLKEGRDINLLVHRYFSAVFDNGDLDYVLDNIGWEGVRNHLAAAYLYHANHGYFPRDDVLNYVEDILSFENSLKRYQVQGFSRVFLLGFYLKLDSIKKAREDWLSMVDIDYGKFFYMSKMRVDKMDWLILMLSHFAFYRGDEAIVDFIKDKTRYDSIYQSLDTEHKKRFISNSLTYAASICEPNFFINGNLN